MDLGARAREARCSVHFGACACPPCRVRRGEATQHWPLSCVTSIPSQACIRPTAWAGPLRALFQRTVLCVRVRVCVNCGRVRACVREWRVCECETVAPHHAQKAQPRSSRAASSPRATSVSLSILITLAAPGAGEINTSRVRLLDVTARAQLWRLAHAQSLGAEGRAAAVPVSLFRLSSAETRVYICFVTNASQGGVCRGQRHREALTGRAVGRHVR